MDAKGNFRRGTAVVFRMPPLGLAAAGVIVRFDAGRPVVRWHTLYYTISAADIVQVIPNDHFTRL